MRKQLNILAAGVMACCATTVVAEPIAFDMVGSASQNLIAYNNAWTDAFTSPGDGFQRYRRGVSPSIPFAIVDDTLSGFPADTVGIIPSTNTDTFFGISDTVNNDTDVVGSAPVRATWEFDISGATNLMLSLDMGAMGDFENADTFAWAYSIDGGPLATVWQAAADTSLTQTYTMESGSVVTHNDPMLVGTTLLSNVLQNFSAALSSTGSVLTVVLTADTNGGTEAFAFQNLLISGDRVAMAAPGIVSLLGIGLLALGLSRRS